MKQTIKAGQLTMCVDSMGAEIISLKKGDKDIIWWGDAEYWGERGLPRYFDICLHQRCFCLIIYIYSQMYSFFLVRQGKSLYFCKALHIIKHDRT